MGCESQTSWDTTSAYTCPIKAITSLCKVTKPLYSNESESEVIEFEIIEQFKSPISLLELQNITQLSQCEPLTLNNLGSLFKLTRVEFETIRSLIDEKNEEKEQPTEPYSKKEALQELFLVEDRLDDILQLLQLKKNVILQGPPGVGKTFIAKRLAYALMGKKASRQLMMIQFHQSYAYEDFIQGFRPSAEGRFILKPGVFYEFCNRAQRDIENVYFFVIDEINRGNLSKIFGELMMLIEADKRGEEFAIPLTYSENNEDLFYIPSNLHIIGTMNTADRSLAMVDYALRRRFGFVTLETQFHSERFAELLKQKGANQELILKVKERMTALNKRIAEDTKNLGPGYQIGHSYFCPNNNRIPLDEAWYRGVIKNEIEPLLREYWFDNPEKCEQEIKRLF